MGIVKAGHFDIEMRNNFLLGRIIIAPMPTGQPPPPLNQADPDIGVFSGYENTALRFSGTGVNYFFCIKEDLDPSTYAPFEAVSVSGGKRLKFAPHTQANRDSQEIVAKLYVKFNISALFTGTYLFFNFGGNLGIGNAGSGSVALILSTSAGNISINSVPINTTDWWEIIAKIKIITWNASNPNNVDSFKWKFIVKKYVGGGWQVVADNIGVYNTSNQILWGTSPFYLFYGVPQMVHFFKFIRVFQGEGVSGL
jgi:hypothetical protein